MFKKKNKKHQNNPNAMYFPDNQSFAPNNQAYNPQQAFQNVPYQQNYQMPNNNWQGYPNSPQAFQPQDFQNTSQVQAPQGRYGGTYPNNTSIQGGNFQPQFVSTRGAYVPKRKNKLLKLFGTILALFIFVFAIFYAANTLKSKGPKFAVAKEARVGKTYSGNALLVRDEIVFDDEGITDIKYEIAEKSRVSRSDIICYVFTSGYSAKEKNALQNYRNQVKKYQVDLLNNESTFDQNMDKYIANTNSIAKQIKNTIDQKSGNMLELEKTLEKSISERQKYFKEKYSEDQRLNRLYDDEITQLKRIESWKKQSHANFDGIVSFYTDGYEYALNTSTVDNFGVDEVERMLHGIKPEQNAGRRGKTDIYRIIRSDDWFALMVIENSTWNPIDGTSIKLTLEQFRDTTVDARIVSSKRMGNKLMLKLAVNGNIDDTLYVRSARAKVGQYTDAIAVPRNAIRQQKDEIGVVVRNGDKNVFVPVDIISSNAKESYVSPKYSGTLNKGDQVLLF